MLKQILSVGGWTLISRLSGFVRDVVMAAVMGAGPIADAFVVAQRLPNHLRTIFGENAFNAAFVPAYLRLRGGDEATGPATGRAFAAQVLTLLLLVQVGLLALAWLAMPLVVAALAPGFVADPGRFDLAVALTRITFPYLLCITLVTVLSGWLNAHGRFAAAAGAPVLLNVSLVAALGVAWAFPTAGHAAAWGVAAAGVLELGLLWAAASRAGLRPGFARPRLDGTMRGFLRGFGLATVGSAGQQIAVLADTVLASFLAVGGVSAFYYADRLYLLPQGIIAYAAGTVLLPTMSRLIAAGDAGAAHGAQNRALGLTLALTAPFLVAFLLIPEPIMAALFARGAFSLDAARRAAEVLQAYAWGLGPLMLISSVRASFYARGDTWTPAMVVLGAVAVNVALKAVLTGPLGAPGLALATSAGSWVTFAGMAVIALRRGWAAPGATLGRMLAAVAAAGAALAAYTLLAMDPLRAWLAGLPAPLLAWREEMTLGVLGAGGALLYALALLAGLRLLGVRLRRA